MTTHDPLTGLPNRELLRERLTGCLAQAGRVGEQVAVMLIDLDDFKGINDSLGHDIGDLLLRHVADRLRRALCDADTLARFGGDAFAAIFRGRESGEIERLAVQVLDYLSVPFRIRSHDVVSGASVGLALFPVDGDNGGDLLRNADTALNEAKAKGRNCFRFFSSEMQARVQQRVTLAAGLRAALDNERFEIVFQPQVALATREIVGAEALLRWKDPVLGSVSAANFVPAAVAARLIVPINDWVLDKVVRQICLWREQGLVPPRISVNIAAEQLRELRFIDRVRELLEARSVPPDAICLELTEGTLMEDLDRGSALLAQLTETGVAVSIDDFGTGYSSLAYLGRLPINELKIDQSFVRDIAADASKRSIIIAIVEMAHALGMHVVAEGIETEEQFAFLLERRCEIGQGYLFHRPLGADAFAQLITPQSHATAAGELRGAL